MIHLADCRLEYSNKHFHNVSALSVSSLLSHSIHAPGDSCTSSASCGKLPPHSFLDCCRRGNSIRYTNNNRRVCFAVVPIMDIRSVAATPSACSDCGIPIGIATGHTRRTRKRPFGAPVLALDGHYRLHCDGTDPRTRGSECRLFANPEWNGNHLGRSVPRSKTRLVQPLSRNTSPDFSCIGSASGTHLTIN